MRRAPERLIAWLIVILPIAALSLLALLSLWFFSSRLTYYESLQQSRYFEEIVATQQARNDVRTTDIVALLQYRNAQLIHTMRSTLKSRVDLAYDTAAFLHERYAGRLDAATMQTLIGDALSQMVWDRAKHYVWITDYSGNNLLAANVQLQEKNLYDYKDADGRYIIREEIAMAKEQGAGWLRSHFASEEREALMYVRAFGHFDWLFGSALDTEEMQQNLQTKLLEMIENIVWEPGTFVQLYSAEGSRLARSHYPGDAQLRTDVNLSALAPGVWTRQGDMYVKKETAGVFGWQIVHGFDLCRLEAGYTLRLEALSNAILREKSTIIEAVGALAFGVTLLAWLLARIVGRIFLRYREQVEVREQALRDFNATLEARVEEEVQKQRQSEKMLIQQSKMAAMGDMISMIAHQWRQPLNQLSYTLMNIEGAYAHHELNQTYLHEKVAEADRTLHYMSHTIDDFRNFFRPDKSRERVALDACVEQTLKLLEKMLVSHHITVETELNCTIELPLYRNEAIQVLINLILNAKDVLSERNVASPTITIACYETGQFVVIRVCDNAGGVNDAHAERIFEPYFSTKQGMHGTGLGLYMSRTIVVEHFNGELTFENRDDGACFYVKIGKTQEGS